MGKGITRANMRQGLREAGRGAKGALDLLLGRTLAKQLKKLGSGVKASTVKKSTPKPQKKASKAYRRGPTSIFGK